MASTVEEAPLHTPPAEERVDELLSGGDSPTLSKRSKEDRRPAVSSPRRNGIPPKRPTTAAKAPVPTASSTAGKTVSTARPTPGGGLSKPPARPMTTSSSRRPAIGVNATTASNSGHVTRPSASSVEEMKKAPTSPGVENRRPIVSGTAKRVSLAPTMSGRSAGPKPTPSADRRSTISSSNAMEKKSSSGRGGVVSPTRTSTRSQAATARSAAALGATRTSRPPPSSTKAIPGAEGADISKKRLSTIPASPAQAPSVSDNTASPSVRDSKPVRPVLTTRKSTLSITIEQRLREMELVSQMLHVAMAEGGDETDEVKEQYGRKMDETLADLREKLEEARRNEGKPPLDPPANQPATNNGNALTAAISRDPDESVSDEVAELRAAATASQDKVMALNSELEATRTKLFQYSKEAEDASKDIEQATAGIRQEQASKINELTALHTSEVEKLRAQLVDQESRHAQQIKIYMHDIEEAKASATDQGSEKTAQVLEEQKSAHEDELKSFHEELERERRNVLSLTSELTMLKAKLEEESQKSVERLATMEQHYSSLLGEKDRVIEVKKDEASNAQHKLEELRTEHNHELKEIEATTSQRIDDIQRGHFEALTRIRDLESNADKASSQHEELLQTRENEISSIGKVVESLQDELQNLRESKDREVDAIRIKLIQDHESKLSKLQAEHELALQAGKDDASKNETSSRAHYEQQLRDLQKRLEATEEAHRGAMADVNDLTSSKDETQKTVESLQNQVVGLKKVLETFDQDSQDKDNQHSTALKKLREELDNTAKQLKEKSMENHSMNESHAAEIENLKQSHAEEIAALHERNDEQAGDTINDLQKKLNKLEQQLADANSNNRTAQDNIRAEHEKELRSVRDTYTSKLEKTEDSHNNELEQLKDAHIKEIEQVRNSLKKELEGARNAHSEEVEQLKDSHMKELEDTRFDHNKQLEKAKDTHTKELDVAKDAHTRNLADVSSSCTKEIEELKLSHTKKLEEMKDSHDRVVADIHGAHRTELAEVEASHAKEVDEARDSLLKELEEAKDACARLERLNRSHEKDLEELKDSHAREAEGLKRDLSQAKGDLNAKITELCAISDKHTTQNSELKRQHEDSLSTLQQEHQKALSELQEQVLQNRKALADAETELHSTRESQSGAERDIRAKHEKELDEVRHQFETAKLDVARLHEELETFRKQNSQIETVVQQRSAECDELRSALAETRKTVAKLTADAEEASKARSDTFELDQLRQELGLMTEKHEAEVAKLQETISLDSEKREKERKQGAEVRDRLVAQLEELEGFRRELPAAEEQVKEHQEAIVLAKKEMQDVQEKLKQVLATSKENEARHKETAAELEKLRTESAKTKSKIKGHARISSEVVQELDALQIIADKEREKTDRMKKQIVDITAAAESQAARVREMEAALKVATAELTELKTKRADGKDFAELAAKRGLRTSRWAAESDEDGFVEIKADPEHEELGSSIEGTMAGLQEQIRQLEGVNDDMIGESERYERFLITVLDALVNMLSRATGNKSDMSLDSPKPHSPLGTVTNSQ